MRVMKNLQVMTNEGDEKFAGNEGDEKFGTGND
jgi:hypothetical protein